MALVELIVLACAISDPKACHEYHIEFETQGSLRSCMMRAEPYLAQWAGEHPSLTIMRWHCAWPGQEDEHT
jgi:hypothetical protein